MIHLCNFKGIGNNDTVIPTNIMHEDLGNLNSCILCSGVLLYDSYMNLKSLNIRKKDVSNIKLYFEAAHFKLQHLFCWRQRLFDCNKKNTLAYKPHGCCHFCWFISFYGPPYNYDTVLYEHMHIECGKHAYTASGRRHETKLQDMMKKIQCRRLVSALGKRMREHGENGKDTNCEDEDDEVVTHRANTSIHNTTSGVIFEGNNSISERQELILERDKLKYKNAVGRNQVQLLNPNTTLELIWSSITRCQNEDVIHFCTQFGTAPGMI